MSIISKHLFYDSITKEIDCRVTHPWNSNCIMSHLTLIQNVIIGASKFYSVLYIVSSIVYIKHIYTRVSTCNDFSNFLAGANTFKMEESKQIIY